MLVLNLCQQYCPHLIPYNVGNKLGDGADGEVFDIIGAPEQVIKFCVLYEYSSYVEEVYEKTSQVLHTLMSENTGVYARVYEYGKLGVYSRFVWGNQQQRFILYYYVMEKLQKISEDERRVFHTLVSHEDQNKQKDFTLEKSKKILAGLARSLDFDAERVTFFCENFRKSSVHHLDIHPRNIMKDSIGNFKLIDFDRTQ